MGIWNAYLTAVAPLDAHHSIGHATPSHLFFQLPGRISWGTEKIEVELKRCNDRALNRDLETLCAKVAQGHPRLPDGRRLLFFVQGTAPQATITMTTNTGSISLHES